MGANRSNGSARTNKTPISMLAKLLAGSHYLIVIAVIGIASLAYTLSLAARRHGQASAVKPAVRHEE